MMTSIVDMSTWIGNWPFLKLRYNTPDTLKVKLQAHSISRAFVSPIEALFEQDPLRANREMLSQLEGDFFSPVPIVDLSYANWRDTMNLAVQDNRVKVIKLLPNYHMYELNEERIAPLIEWTQKHKLVISIQIRFEDMRGMHPLMVVPDVDVLKAAKTASNFPEQQFIFNNLYLGELNNVLHAQKNVWVDLPCLDHADILHQLKNQYSLENILFSSHSPFLVAESAISKLKYTDAAPEDIRKVAIENAQRLFQN